MNSVTSNRVQNGFHGDAFEFFRNGDLNARNFFSPTQDTLKRNQFGGTVGGPIKKNKIFFFFGYQGTTIRQTPSPTTSFGTDCRDGSRKLQHVCVTRLQ